MSIASLDFKKNIEGNNIKIEDELPENDYTESDFLKTWKRFCEIQKKNGNSNLYSLLRMNEPILEDNLIIISTLNKMNFKELSGFKNDIQLYLSRELSNYSISVEIRLSKGKSKKTFTDSKEKLKIIMDDNKSLKKLISEFKLRI